MAEREATFAPDGGLVEAPDAGTEVALFATDRYLQDREGIGIYARSGGAGFIVSVDQLPEQSVFHVYRRSASDAAPAQLLAFRAAADSTDGLDVTSEPLGPEFPEGLLVAMNSKGRNFLLFDWRSVAAALSRQAAPER